MRRLVQNGQDVTEAAWRAHERVRRDILREKYGALWGDTRRS